jgi:uncharacterized surface protein with fasciclin (FAS1) repeats
VCALYAPLFPLTPPRAGGCSPQANLAGALSGPGPFTVFAPTNEAFVKALGALKLSKAQLLDLPTLANILKFHGET